MWRGLLETFDKARVAVFGITTDQNCSIMFGAKDAPAVIRQCSEFLPPTTVRGEVIEPCLVDLGDVTEYDYAQVEEKIKNAKGKQLVLMLGGDHSVSILSQKAVKNNYSGKIGIIHIDAHADICDVYNGSAYSHACVNRRAIDNGYSPADITMVGIRSFELDELEYLKDNPVTVYRTDEVRKIGVKAVLDRIVEKYKDYDHVYLSFDIDSVDPSYAPGTGTPEHFGLTSNEVLSLLCGIVGELPVSVMDIVEVSPSNDVNNITTWLALKCILEILEIITRKEDK